MKSFLPNAPAVLTLAFVAASAVADDWPAYRHDIERTAASGERLVFPLHPAWRYAAAQAPHPAWPEPVKVLNRLDFDYAPQPVVANGIVCFGSSADDTIRALDRVTGATKWQFTTGGPVRFAPHIADGRVHVASDDGFAYCLDAATGKLIWKFRAAPGDERLLGNERMISRWPARTGVLVADGVAYTTAGMWSSESVFVYALDAATGRVLWCNDTSGIVNKVRTLHVESATDPTSSDFGTFGVCPQGMLAASGDTLVVPTGKGLPAAYERKSGRLKFYSLDPFLNTAGGSSIAIDGDRVFVNAANPGSLFALDLASGRHDVKTGRFGEGAFYTAHPHHWSLGRAYRLYDREKVSTIILNGKPHFRMAYALAKAGGVIFSGENDAVLALNAETKEEIWRAPVNGEARGLAIADGCLVVTTDRGEVTCFTSGPVAPVVVHDPAARFGKVTPPPDDPAVGQLLQQGIDRGYVVILGDETGRLSSNIAARTQLHVVNVLPASAAVTLREKLIANTVLYGSRVEVHGVENFERLPFAQYFANAVVVAGVVPNLSGRELYRVLRPCGGLLIFPNVARAAAAAWVKDCGALPGEIRASEKQVSILRGPLAGARDWDTGTGPDQLVKWPLRLLWFGGPGPALVMDRKQGNVIGPVANGRYFVFGEDVLSAVDAYNGSVLWTRQVPRYYGLLPYVEDKAAIAGMKKSYQLPFVRNLSADAEHVYLTLGCYFKGDSREKGCIQINARTGEQEKIHGSYTPPPNVSLKTTQSWPLEIDAVHSGSVSVQATKTGLTLKLTTKDPVIAPLDRWDLFFDFRPFDQRYGLYERGTFHERIFPAKDAQSRASSIHATGPLHPALDVSGTREAGGTSTTVELSWAEVRKLTGVQPSSFGFALTLSSHDGKEKEDVVQKHLFGDIMADGLNNGWANVQLDGADNAGGQTPTVIAGPFSSMPKIQPSVATHPTSSAQSAKLAPRIHPLTGEREAKFFQTGSFGCGGLIHSSDCIMARSTALSIYDFADDSGTRHFDGTKPSCTGSITAALGLLLSSEGRGGCECTTNFQTSLALAPADRRSNEDWALYYDRDVDSMVRQAAINFGAPGDRRDSGGTLWLGFPRVGGKMIGVPLVPDGTLLAGTGVFRQKVSPLQIPIECEVIDGFGPARVNADRVPIAGTENPWLYTSAYKGIRKAALKLNFGKPIASKPCAVAPRLDGKLDGPAWAGDSQAMLPSTKTEVFVRHDAENLYIAARRPAVNHSKGHPVPWSINAATETDAFFKGESIEIFLADESASRIIHLAVNPAGSRYDALTTAAGEDRKWTADWKSAVAADEKGFVAEFAVPWKTLADAGVAKDRLLLNAQVNTTLPYGYGLRSEALRYVGAGGRERCTYFLPVGLGKAPPVAQSRFFTVRLHFAELDDLAPGQRVFSVKLQGQIVLKDFDVVRDAGGRRKALVREFKHVAAGELLTLEFIPRGSETTTVTVPILSALELFEEGLGLRPAQ